jgi:hypothetical protein
MSGKLSHQSKRLGNCQNLNNQGSYQTGIVFKCEKTEKALNRQEGKRKKRGEIVCEIGADGVREGDDVVLDGTQEDDDCLSNTRMKMSQKMIW